MLRKINWDKWGLDFFMAVMRHAGTAGMVYMGLSVKTGKFSWEELGQSLLIGAILPTLFTSMQQPLPMRVEVTTVENASGKMTQTTTTQIESTEPQQVPPKARI